MEATAFEAILADWQRRGANLALVHSLPVLTSVLVWTSIYKTSGWWLGLVNDKLELPATHSFKWRCRVVSFFFSTTILWLAFYCLLFDSQLKGDSFTSYSSVAYYTCTIAVGYFLWDVILCLCHYDEFQFSFLFHGLACFLTFVSFLDGKFMYYGCFYLTFEASTPFLNLQWLMEKMALPKAHPLKIINGLVLVLAFLVFRILLGIGYSFYVFQDIYSRMPTMTDWSDRHFGYYNLFAIISLSLLNIYWFSLLSRLFLALVMSSFGQKESRKAK